MTEARRGSRLPNAQALRTFMRHMAGPTRVSVVRAAVDGLVVAQTLRTRGVRSLVDDAGTARTLDPDRAQRVAVAVDAAFGLIPVAPTCLRRSLTLIRELKRLGLGSVLHIGVRNVAGSIEAHAWVQVGSVVVNDAPDVVAAYVELAGGEFEALLARLT